eukprot:TRINITY_DN4703_c0_g1_i2.p2 TRINITY_DN4703_c0_g1~~TRINITY_DN4703_c0_g1_i2.p2  ORF type:complete len:151 (+),score=71.31 TRINITY_DN4703_c0_g1_i2:147-599(+)
MDYLTQDLIDECKYYFDLLDKNGTGKLTTKEMSTVFKSIGIGISEAELKELLNELGSTSEGPQEISFPDFATLLTRKMKDFDTDTELKELFHLLDKGGKGYLNVEDLKHLREAVGEKYTAEELAEMLAEADVDHDGMLKYEDFTKMMLSQ